MRKVWPPPYPPPQLWNKNKYHHCSSTRMALTLNNPRICRLTKKRKPKISKTFLSILVYFNNEDGLYSSSDNQFHLPFSRSLGIDRSVLNTTGITFTFMFHNFSGIHLDLKILENFIRISFLKYGVDTMLRRNSEFYPNRIKLLHFKKSMVNFKYWHITNISLCSVSK